MAQCPHKLMTSNCLDLKHRLLRTFFIFPNTASVPLLERFMALRLSCVLMLDELFFEEFLKKKFPLFNQSGKAGASAG